jgi:phospholipase C
VTPPFGAVTPDAASNPGEDGFTFNRFGPRIPAVVVSPWVAAGTVFRSDNGTPYDHTSILATLRDWLSIPPQDFLTSHRITHAPTLDQVLSLDQPRQDLPVIPPPPEGEPVEVSMEEPPNVLQDSMAMAAEAARLGRPLAPPEAAELRARMLSRADAGRLIPLRESQLGEDVERMY